MKTIIVIAVLYLDGWGPAFVSVVDEGGALWSKESCVTHMKFRTAEAMLDPELSDKNPRWQCISIKDSAMKGGHVVVK